MRISNAARWSLAALVVVAALVVAIWPRGGSDEQEVGDYPGAGRSTSQQERRASDSPEALAPLRAEAALAPCPVATGPAPDGSVLTGITLECLGDGTRVDLGGALAGKPVLLNIWAYWCGPCREELPYLQQYADRAGAAVTVLTVHTDSNEANALARLAEYDVHLPGVQDGAVRVQAAVGSPAVLPVSVLIRPDGTVAKILPQPFRSVDEIADVVQQYLGVAA
ncbi:TlpA family protein disulfide reductase [Rhodococcus sp. AG1013]|uniref:TlpA family protein disulfide reductase n=1 Tax=unclassified Rhodococcus (in: high G+C Gram-positive bacteria) TaxID=192944 RepID=UPI000E0C9F15|nr:TlpA disulfide reductase family protein [Rhodococcus sp. AG1013]RDI28061.1 thiol-disulfide isomerase/thioredoxin [Rhodococcus sp. AG1013]